MSAHAGPKIINDNLVFHYDISNTQKSWKGPPTTNLAAGTFFYGNGVNFPVNRDIIDIMPNGTAGTARELNAQIVSDPNRTVSIGSYSLTAGSTYTLSFYVKNINCTGFGGNLYSPTLGRVIGGINYPSVSTTGWTRVITTFTVPSEGYNPVTLSPQVFRDGGVGFFRLCWLMLEQSSNASTYTPVARTNTQAIVDLTNNHSITASNLTYNSDGSFSFNGTSDYMHPSINHSYKNSSCLEVVFNSTSHGTGFKTIFGYAHNYNYSNPTIGSIYLNNNTLSASVITATEVYRVVTAASNINTNAIYHVCLNKDTTNGTLQLYVNGVLSGSQTFNAATYGQWTTAGSWIGQDILDIGKSTNTSSGQGWSTDYFSGKIYVAKVYNRTLSAAEILQNYNALKERYFGYQKMLYISNNSNVTLTNNGTEEVTMFKTASNNSWDSHVYSSDAFTAPCTIEFTKNAASGDNGASYAMIGWNADPLTSSSYDSLDWASYPYRTDIYSVYHNASQVNFTGAWDPNKRFYVVYDTDGYIRHYNGSTLLYSVNKGTGLTVYVDSSFYSVNSTYGGFTNVKVCRKSWNGTSYV